VKNNSPSRVGMFLGKSLMAVEEKDILGDISTAPLKVGNDGNPLIIKYNQPDLQREGQAT
jgi:hypothetical protein